MTNNYVNPEEIATSLVENTSTEEDEIFSLTTEECALINDTTFTDAEFGKMIRDRIKSQVGPGFNAS